VEKRRRKMLAKGDQAFAAHKFSASVTMPAYLSGIFRVRLPVFVLGSRHQQARVVRTDMGATGFP
jgi:hypothetical protein